MADDRLSHEEAAAARARRLTAMGLQLIEDSPVSAESIAMFEMFERERWSHDRCRAYIADKYAKVAMIDAGWPSTHGYWLAFTSIEQRTVRLSGFPCVGGHNG